MTTNTCPVVDKQMWDSLGNNCRIELYKIGQESFELYTNDFNGAVPSRYVGGLGELMERGQRWIDSKKAAGFMEQLPSFNPDARIA